MTFRCANSRRHYRPDNQPRICDLGAVVGDPPLPMRPVLMDLPQFGIRRGQMWAGIIAAILFVAMLWVAAKHSII